MKNGIGAIYCATCLRYTVFVLFEVSNIQMDDSRTQSSHFNTFFCLWLHIDYDDGHTGLHQNSLTRINIYKICILGSTRTIFTGKVNGAIIFKFWKFEVNRLKTLRNMDSLLKKVQMGEKRILSFIFTLNYIVF